MAELQARAIEGSAGESGSRRWLHLSSLRCGPPLTQVGLAIGFGTPFVAGLCWRVSAILGCTGAELGGVLLLLELLIVAALLALILRFEGYTVGSVGIRRLEPADWKLGLTGSYVVVCLVLLGAGLYLVFNPDVRHGLIARLAPADAAALRRASLWVMLALAAASAGAQELAARGYTIERLSRLTGSVWVAAGAGVILAMLSRLPWWGFSFLLLVAPVECALAALYVRYRKLAPCVIARTALNLLIVLAILVGVGGVGGNELGAMAAGAPSSSSRAAAIKALNHAMGEDDPARPHCERAQAAFAKGDYRDAIDEVTKAIAIEPKNARLMSFRGSCYWESGDHDKAIADFTAAIRLDPDNDFYYRQRAAAYGSLNDVKRALADLTIAINLRPQDPENYFERGKLSYRQNQTQVGIEDLDEAIKLDPKNLTYLYVRARMYQSLGDYQHAIADCSRMIANEPKTPDGYGCRADAYGLEGDFQKAIADLNAMEPLVPPSSQLVYARAKYEQQAGDWKALGADLVKLSNFSDLSAEDADWAAWQLSTNEHDEVRNGKAAIILATRACAQNGWRNPSYISALAAAYAEAGDFRQAIGTQERAIAAAMIAEPDAVESMRQELDILRSGRPLRLSELAGPSQWRHRAARLVATGFAMIILMIIGFVTVCVIALRFVRGFWRAAAARAA